MENKITKFWNSNQDGKVSINNYLFKKFLEQNNYFKSRPNSLSSYNLIRKDDIFLNIVDEIDIKDFVIDYVLENEFSESVFNLITSKTSMFKREFLSMIKNEEIKTLRDTKETSYLFYKNGILEVTKDKSILKKYSDFDLYVWKDQVIDRDYTDADHHESEYRTFIWKISGGFDLPSYPTMDEQNRYKQAVQRYNTFQSIIGYLLHSYNSSGDSKAIILNDEMISDEPNGRSGKGLFWNALKYLKKVQSLNGKSFSFTADFPYQSVKTDCQLLVFDDVRKSFDFEMLFSVVTEGLDITYKGQNTIKLPLEDSPKILITTNYTLKGSGGSQEARRFEVELSTFFNSKHTPIDFFGHKLFDSWSNEEWSRFDNYMIQCLQKYLSNGLMEYERISLPLKKLQTEINIEMYNQLHNLKLGNWYNYELLFSNYNSGAGKFGTKTKTAYTQAINKYCAFFGLTTEFSEQGGVRQICFSKQEPKQQQTEPDIWDELNEKAKQ